MKNGLAPINRIPPEVLALTPDYWDRYQIIQALIPLTHVCRAWREVFVSRSSLWTDFDCEDADKTRVYFERAKSSLLNLRLERDGVISPHDPFLQIVPRAIGQLKSLSINGTLENLQYITTRLSRPAPLLERLVIDGGSDLGSGRNPVLKVNLFNGDLSSLRELHLLRVHTDLPWRNMVNLTSLMLDYFPPDGTSIGQLLDFFEGAPYLRKVRLGNATPTLGGQNGRLVSLAHLKRMDINGGGPSSPLLDHLIIPVGAKLGIHVDSFGHTTEDHLPRSLGNLRNLPNFTDVYVGEIYPRMRIRGPNGQLHMTASNSDTTCLVIEFLARFDVSRTERLHIADGNHPFRGPPHRVLFAMESLRTLILSRCVNSLTFAHVLNPNTNSSNAVFCPKLEEIVFVPCAGREFNIGRVIAMAGARASRGMKLRTVRIIGGQNKVNLVAELELRKHVSHVENGSEGDVVSDESDEED